MFGDDREDENIWLVSRVWYKLQKLFASVWVSCIGHYFVSDTKNWNQNFHEVAAQSIYDISIVCHKTIMTWEGVWSWTGYKWLTSLVQGIQDVKSWMI